MPACGVIVPSVALPPTMPLTSQMTLVSLNPLTVAEKGCERPSSTLAEGGEIVMPPTALIVTVNAVALAGSAAGVAGITIVFGEGGVAGAV